MQEYGGIRGDDDHKANKVLKYRQKKHKRDGWKAHSLKVAWASINFRDTKWAVGETSKIQNLLRGVGRKNAPPKSKSPLKLRTLKIMVSESTNQ